jgi:FixJ family two-component response regulator
LDDDEAVLDSVRLLLESVEYRVKTFDSPATLLACLPEIKAGCLILDVRMPGMSGLELQQRLRQNRIPLPIIFITGHGDVPMAVQAMQSGAFDFLEKPFRDQDLLDRVAEAVALDCDRRHQLSHLGELRERLEQLSQREREVLERVARGQPNKLIAADLDLSQRTVEIHRARVMEKMRAQSLADLVRMMLVLEQNSATAVVG